MPAASLWSGARRWVATFREAGMQAGDRLVVALPASPAFLQLLLASLWEGLTLAFLPPAESVDIANVLNHLDARAAVALPSCSRSNSYSHSQEIEAVWHPDSCCGPQEGPVRLRTSQSPPTPDIRFLLRTSGTTGPPRWAALSDANLFAVLDSHADRLGLQTDSRSCEEPARLISVLPWHHAFGLVIELLPALLAGAEIVRDPSNGRDPENIQRLVREHGSTHLSCVPLTLQKLVQRPDGEALIQTLGGVVGGAPVSQALASLLTATRFQVGYGQTEASPGIALGEPGVWRPHYLGRALGCQVRLSQDGVLEFSGSNACAGWWTEQGLEPLAPDRWVRTGDLVTMEGEDLIFVGRADDCFKLSNGRAIEAGRWEGRLREAFPQLHDALLYSPDGDLLSVGYLPHQEAAPPDNDAFRMLLQGLGSRLASVAELPTAVCRYTPKGELDRAATRQLLRTNRES